MRYDIFLIAALTMLCTACDDGALTFPEQPPAKVRIVNVTQDVGVLTTIVDQTQAVSAVRGASANVVTTPAGRPIGFVLMEGNEALRRDTLFYTLGGNGNVILFTRGAKTTLVEFRRVIHDTTLNPLADPVIRFTHMAENVSQFATVEVWISGGRKLFDQDFDYGVSSRVYEPLTPGTYSFEVREYKTTNVAATLQNVSLERGKSYMLYTWDASPVKTDSVALSVF
jgi:hypothetical protein